MAMDSRSTGPHSSPRILFSSPCKPLGPRYGDAFSCSANGAFQLTWAQEGFRSEDMMWHWGLDLIAENLRAPSVVLQFPTRRRFIRELEHGYDYVGLTLNLCTLHVARWMCAAVRRVSPRSKIILGGYGTILPDEELVGDDGLPLGDLICRGEGISFMRCLLGEPDGPVRHPRMAIDRKVFSVPLREKTGIVFSSVGCPNGCDFCVTSQYFRKRRISFFPSGRDMFRSMEDHAAADPAVSSFSILDEDFLVDEARGREFLEEARRGGRLHDAMIFTSLRALSRFTAEEIASMGVSRIWIGFEAEGSGYPKLSGRPYAEQVAALRAVGVSVVASMIIGYDYQDRGIIEAEFRRLCAARPSAIQILLFSPCHGTEAWSRLDGQGRILDSVRKAYRRHDGFTELFRHPHFRPGELEALAKELSRREFREMGPSMFRLFAAHHEGWRNLKDSPDAVLRERARASGIRLKRCLTLYPAGMVWAPSRAVRSRIRAEFAEMKADFGPLSLAQRLAAAVLILLYPWTRWRFAAERFTQPSAQRREYSGNGQSHRTRYQLVPGIR